MSLIRSVAFKAPSPGIFAGGCYGNRRQAATRDPSKLGWGGAGALLIDRQSGHRVVGDTDRHAFCRFRPFHGDAYADSDD
jgi:hypothetical protein